MKSMNAKSTSESTHAATPFLSGDKKGSFFSSSFNNNNSFFGPSAIQPKLEIGQPDDKYEQEADRVADTVMRMPDPQVQRQPVEEEEEELQMKRQNTIIQRKCKECEKEEKLQKKSEGSTQSANPVSSNISNQLASQAGTGSRLPKPVRSEMAHKMGADFGGVNIHAGPAAHKLNRQLGARAFTHGSDIYFNKGEYNPDSSEGKHLLAHELTHVVQQGASNYIRREPLSNEQRENYVDNIIAEMGITHSDYNDGAQDADQAISAEAQANADLAKAIFSISMAVIIPGFGGIISGFTSRFGIAISSSAADHIGGVIGEAAKVAGESQINQAFQGTEQNQLFVTIANGLEESARIKREYLLEKKYDSSAIPDSDLEDLYQYWLSLGRLDRNIWNNWFQDKYRDYLQQVRPIGEQTDQRYGTNKLLWIEGEYWRGLALTAEGRYFMTSNRPTFISWISPSFRESAERRHETAIGTRNISAVHYTNLETDGSTTRSEFENILDNPNRIAGNVVLTQAVGNVQPGSGSYCPTCHGQGGGVGPELNRGSMFEDDEFNSPMFDLNEFENQSINDVDTEAVLRWLESSESQ